MRVRRSRFSRIYRQVTRRRTVRRQWQQISQLRPKGSLGHPAASQAAYSYAPFSPAMDEPQDLTATEWQPSYSSVLEYDSESTQPIQQESASAPAGFVAGLSIALFLLACAYAGFSGFMHASNDALAWFGIVGAVGCLASVGVGITLWASDARRYFSGRFLAVAGCFLVSFFCVLLLCR